jgi:hypothetical protein
MAKKNKTWRCICGKVFDIDGKEIRCTGKGHNVYLSPQYFNYQSTTKDEEQFQLKLL